MMRWNLPSLCPNLRIPVHPPWSRQHPQEAAWALIAECLITQRIKKCRHFTDRQYDKAIKAGRVPHCMSLLQEAIVDLLRDPSATHVWNCNRLLKCCRCAKSEPDTWVDYVSQRRAFDASCRVASQQRREVMPVRKA